MQGLGLQESIDCDNNLILASTKGLCCMIKKNNYAKNLSQKAHIIYCETYVMHFRQSWRFFLLV